MPINDEDQIHAYSDCPARSACEDVIDSSGFVAVPGNRAWVDYLDARISCRLCWNVATGAIPMPRVASETERACVEQVRNYVKQRTGHRSLDPDEVHALDVGAPTEAYLTLTALRVVLDLLDRKPDPRA